MRLLGRRSGLLYAARESASARAARWGLKGAWNGEDTSDSFGANTLTNNNAATFSAGKLSNAFTLAAASLQFFSVADNAALSSGDVDILVAGWANFATLGAGSKALAGKFTDATNREWALYYDSSADGAEVAQRVRFKTYDAAGSQAGIVSTAASPGTGAWKFFVGYRAKVAAQVAISVDGGAFVTAAETAVTADTTARFLIGALTDGGSSWLDGQIDAVAFFKPPAGTFSATMAAEIRDYLWNGGAGRQYPAGWT